MKKVRLYSNLLKKGPFSKGFLEKTKKRSQRMTIEFENLKNNFKERLVKSENLQLVTKSLRSL